MRNKIRLTHLRAARSIAAPIDRRCDRRRLRGPTRREAADASSDWASTSGFSAIGFGAPFPSTPPPCFSEGGCIRPHLLVERRYALTVCLSRVAVTSFASARLLLRLLSMPAEWIPVALRGREGAASARVGLARYPSPDDSERDTDEITCSVFGLRWVTSHHQPQQCPARHRRRGRPAISSPTCTVMLGQGGLRTGSSASISDRRNASRIKDMQAPPD